LPRKKFLPQLYTWEFLCLGNSSELATFKPRVVVGKEKRVKIEVLEQRQAEEAMSAYDPGFCG